MSDDIDTRWQVGDFVTVGDSLGVAVPLHADWDGAFDLYLEDGLDHVGVWNGLRDDKGRPLVRTVPTEYVKRAAPGILPRFRDHDFA